MNHNVVVYNSRWQQEADTFWFEHPTYLLIGIGVLVLIFLGIWAWGKITNK